MDANELCFWPPEALEDRNLYEEMLGEKMRPRVKVNTVQLNIFQFSLAAFIKESFYRDDLLIKIT